MKFCHKRNSLKFKRLLIDRLSNYPQKYSFLGTWQAKKNDYLPTFGVFFEREPSEPGITAGGET
jgi:hypothetical protein